MQNISQNIPQDSYPLNSDKPSSFWRIVSKLLKRTSSSLETIFGNNQTRHSIHNETTRYLEKLELEFADNKKELAKIRNIVVLDNEHIKIWKFIHKLWIISTDEDIKHWIYNRWSTTFFTQKAAIEFTQSHPWYKLYNSNELKSLIKSIPWKSKHKQIEVICKLLQIPIVGHIDPLWNMTDDTCLLSSTSSFEIGVHYSLAMFEGPKICHLFNWIDIPWYSLFWLWTEQSAYLLVVKKNI